MTALHQPMNVFFAACMAGLMPLRKRGAFGTPDAPKFFAAKESVPWFADARWPLDLTLVFLVDCETYYEDGWQVVRPLWAPAQDLMYVSSSNGAKHALIVGAPTALDQTPRHGGPKPKPLHELSLEPT